MTRIFLVLLFAVSVLISFSVQAGNRNGHHYKHHGGHNYHHGHLNSHSNRHSYGYKNYYGYYPQPQLHRLPHVAVGTHYGFSPSGALIVYPSYPYRNRHHGYDYYQYNQHGNDY